MNPSPRLHIGRTGLGIFYVYAQSPYERPEVTKRLVPELTAVSIYDMVAEDELELHRRFGHLLGPSTVSYS